jgi:cation diffusion facilitator family transporter
MPDMPLPATHSHVFLGKGHEQAERRTWWVIALCFCMMVAEIVGGMLFGSIALVADGLHMSTHAGALLLAAFAYRFARKYAHDSRFTFGTGKLGDLAGFTSAIVLAMIALLIGYEAVARVFAPVPIRFAEAIPIAVLGLAVNIASVWLLSGGHHHHHHSHGHGPADADHDHAAEHRIATPAGLLVLSVFEEDHPPVFRVRTEAAAIPKPETVSIETLRPAGARQVFTFEDRGGYLQSTAEIPEPHAFTAELRIEGRSHPVAFEEHGEHVHSAAHRDNNMRAAMIHVMADAAVSVLVIAGLLLARAFGWLWMDPLAGLVGACVIASWSYGLVRDTGAILLDLNPDRRMTEQLRQTIECDGDQIADLHLWRLGPGHLGAIVSVITREAREPGYYRDRLAHFPSLSHVTIEVQNGASAAS